MCQLVQQGSTYIFQMITFNFSLESYDPILDIEFYAQPISISQPKEKKHSIFECFFFLLNALITSGGFRHGRPGSARGGIFVGGGKSHGGRHEQ